MFTSLQPLLNKVQQKLHHFFSPESDDEVKRLQYFWTACGGVGFLVLSYGLVTFLFNAAPLKQAETKKSEATQIESALSKVDIHDTWRHKIEDLLDRLTQRTEAVEKLFQESLKREDSPQIPSTEEQELEDSLMRDSLSKEVTVDVPTVGGTQAGGTHHTSTESSHFEDLKEKVLQLEMRFAERNNANDSYGSFASSQDSGIGNQGEVNIIQKVTLGLVEGPHQKQLNTVETTIPAGAFAKTVLLSGLDASSAMNASSDPRPMLLRIIDHGTLPRRFQSDLKDCHCTAGAYGDLSSERVYARLEKLTCVERKTGEIIETQVSGYVAGSDGKAGIRGIVASRDGQFLARSLMGGIFSGLSNVANPQNRKAQMSPFAGSGLPGTGGVMAGPSMGENFAAGMAGGATTALDRLSQYYIDRAEQLQPVIQVAAGQVVDIVFTMGTFIGSETIRSEIEKRDQSHREDPQTHQQPINERN